MIVNQRRVSFGPCKCGLTIRRCIERLEAFADSSASSTMRAQWDTYIYVRTFEMVAYSATQIQELKARIQYCAETLKAWLADGLPHESDKSSAVSVSTTSDSVVSAAFDVPTNFKPLRSSPQMNSRSCRSRRLWKRVSRSPGYCPAFLCFLTLSNVTKTRKMLLVRTKPKTSGYQYLRCIKKYLL